MFKVTNKTLTWGGVELSFESGRLARQADGAVLARSGDTCVFATVTADKTPRWALIFCRCR